MGINKSWYNNTKIVNTFDVTEVKFYILIMIVHALFEDSPVQLDQNQRV